MLLQQVLELLYQDLVALVGEANPLVGGEDVLLRKQLLEGCDLLSVEGCLPNVCVVRQELLVPRMALLTSTTLSSYSVPSICTA